MEDKAETGHESLRPPIPSRKKPAENSPPPGLNQDRHARAQEAAAQADALRRGVFASLMADALGSPDRVEGFRIFLDNVLKDTGHPKDPIEAMIIEQLALAHFRIGLLHADAAKAKTLEATKILNSVVARMLGEFRRTVLALRVYRGRAPSDNDAGDRRVLKMAQ